MKLPKKMWGLNFCITFAALKTTTSVDSGFFEKDFSSEGLGITPDVKIPLPFARKLTDNIDEWVLWVAEDLKKSPFASI